MVAGGKLMMEQPQVHEFSQETWWQHWNKQIKETQINLLNSISNIRSERIVNECSTEYPRIQVMQDVLLKLNQVVYLNFYIYAPDLLIVYIYRKTDKKKI